MFLPILGLFLTLLTFAGTVVQKTNVVSVCEILATPKKYDGQIVSLRAMLVSSLNDTNFDELGPLEAERCYRSRRRDDLRISIGGGYTPKPPEDFKPDLASYDRAANMLDVILEKDPQIRQILVTVEGIIYDGGPEPSGVTKHPWHPALMLISSWKDIRKP